jgi:hypothetical protein
MRDNYRFRHSRGAKPAHEKTVLQGQTAASDKQIDQLVHELCGLAGEEIAIVKRGR